MEKIKVFGFQLQKMEYGWVIVPKYGEEDILHNLYGFNYYERDLEYKSFYPDMSKEEVVEYVLGYVESVGYTVELVEETNIRISKIPIKKSTEYSIDLRWTLWTTDLDVWEDEVDDYKKILKEMKEAFNGKRKSVKVHTSPSKSSSYGTVIITKGKADVSFEVVWDSPICHIPENCPKELRQEFLEEISMYFSESHGYQDGDSNCPIGAESGHPNLVTKSFKKLIKEIKMQEDLLYKAEDEELEYFNKFIEDTTKMLMRQG